MKITEAFGYDEIEEARKGLTMEQFVKQYADEIFTRSSTRNPTAHIKVIKHLFQIELDALIVITLKFLQSVYKFSYL